MAIYKKRVLDRLLEDQLGTIGAVLIEGPKQCGKTTTAKQTAGSVLYMAEAGKMEQNIAMASLNPKLLLSGAAPRLIDEWQLAPQLWDAVRFEVDERAAVGQFILTGSAVSADRSKIFHSGTGRIAWLKMRTMSLMESGESNGTISLKELFAGHTDIAAASQLQLRDIAFLICRGGWPAALPLAEANALRLVADYVEAVVRTDVSRVDGVERQEERVRKLMRIYARSQGAQTPTTAICEDLRANDEDTLSERTVQSYLNALKQIFVIEDLPAWNPNLRSKTAVRTSDTRYFSDPSVATASLRVGPDKLMEDLKTMGFLFETLCIRDLRVYADALDGDVYHYRDKTGLECDAVLNLRNGSYGLIEIKIGGQAAIEHGVETLLRLQDKIDIDKMPAPSFLMVLTAVGDYAYRRKDGVLVVPIGTLGV